MDLKYFVLTFIGLFIGSLLAGFIVPMLPLQLDGWLLGILIGIVQMIILVFLGVVASHSIIQIGIGGILIFIGSILGGFLVGYINLTGWYATIAILFVQMIVLMLTGFIKGSKAAIPLAGKVK